MFAPTPTGRFDLTPAGRRIAAVALLLLTCVILLPPYAHRFVGDDFMQLWRIRDLLPAPWEAWRVFGPTWTDWYYRPVQHLWFLLNRLLFGYNPLGYYVLQIHVHLLAVALLYRLARRLRLGRIAALSAALFFALSGAHQETVGWIAAIAIIAGLTLTLGALLALLRYLDRGGAARAAAALLLTAAALTAHESAVLTPLLLVGVAWQRRFRPRRPLTVPLLAAGLLLMGGYVALQLWRPNVHISAGDTLSSGLAPLLSDTRAAGFVIALLQAWSAGWINLQPLAGAGWLLVLAAALPAGALLWRGGSAVRLATAWTLLQLGFVYAAVWGGDPDVFGGRHLYAAWAGAALLLGMGTGRLLQWLREEGRGQERAAAALAGLALALLLLPQILAIRSGQNAWLALTQQADQRRAELQTVLPTVTGSTHLYATRFMYSPLYFPRTAAVWYRRPEIPGGTLTLLLETGRVTPDYFLFDENSDGLYLLMPELQEHAETWLLLGRPADGRETDTYTIAGPANQRRLSLPQTPDDDGWTANSFHAGVTAGSSLAFAIWGDPDVAYRVRVDDAIIWEARHGGNRQTPWTRVLVDMAPWWNEEITITLETSGAGEAYWANPRLVRGGDNR